MEVRLHASLDAFRSVAVDVYLRDPVMATIELMVLRGRLVDRNPAPVLLTVADGEVTVGAAFQTLRSPLLCGGLPEAAVDAVVAALVGANTNLNGVHGPLGTVTTFAAAWCAATGARSAVSTSELLHRSAGVSAPTATAGESRLADSCDEQLIAQWLNMFRGESLGVVVDPGIDPRRVRTAKEPPDEIIVWTVDGEPVSMAGVRRPAAGVSRIGPVFTPADRRERGYGSAVTAAAAAWALDAGADEVVLFTDQTKPAIAGVYRGIGFEPVAEFARIDFSGRAHGPRGDASA